MAAQNNQYQEFNNFQQAFYTNIKTLSDFSRFDFKRHGYALLNNLAKGFPNLVNIIINLKGFGWVGAESPALIMALQRTNFVTKMKSGVPQFIYFKQNKPEKQPKVRKTKKGLVFDDSIKADICTKLLMDSKTYEYLKFSPAIQKLGAEMIGKLSITKTKKKRKKAI